MEGENTMKKFNANSLVAVKNGFMGKLVYVSPKTGEVFVWDAFGDERELEIGELKAAKAVAKGFFAKHWFIFEDPEVMEFLGVGDYYKNHVEAETLLKMAPAEIEAACAKLTPEQRRTLSRRVWVLCNGENAVELDSIRTLNALEAALGMTLRERE
jgi:hypothetical protein